MQAGRGGDFRRFSCYAPELIVRRPACTSCLPSTYPSSVSLSSIPLTHTNQQALRSTEDQQAVYKTVIARALAAVNHARRGINKRTVGPVSPASILRPHLEVSTVGIAEVMYQLRGPLSTELATSQTPERVNSRRNGGISSHPVTDLASG
jgi:hypothetical protein